MSPFVQLVKKLVEQLCEVGTYLFIEQFIFVTEVRIKLLLLHLCILFILIDDLAFVCSCLNINISYK